VVIQKRRKASAARHEISNKDRVPVAGPESAMDRARFMNNAALALDVPDQVPNGPGATREDFVRRARLLLHYRQN
jgi:hypothetical protein